MFRCDGSRTRSRPALCRKEGQDPKGTEVIWEGREISTPKNSQIATSGKGKKRKKREKKKEQKKEKERHRQSGIDMETRERGKAGGKE